MTRKRSAANLDLQQGYKVTESLICRLPDGPPLTNLHVTTAETFWHVSFLQQLLQPFTQFIAKNRFCAVAMLVIWMQHQHKFLQLCI